MASTEEKLAAEPATDSEAETPGYIELVDLEKTFSGGRIVACENINISIGQSEFIVLLGPSGCGKTTTLRSIAGLETPDEGQIYIDGEEVTNKRPKDRNLAFVFQSIALFPHKTVRENIRFGLDMKTNLPKDEKNQKVENAAEILGIEELLDRKPSELSGGQQQRVSLGRAMVMDPDAFLLDEPFAALDAKLKDMMETEVKELQRNLETSMIFVTHDQEEAMTLGDRIIVMDDGRIQQIGEPYEIYNNPENIFISQFIGSPTTNIFDCTIRRDGDGDGLSVEHDLFSVDLSDRDVRLNVEDGQTVELGIRPEHLDIDSGSSRFNAEVMLVEPKGTNDVVHLEAGEYEFKSYPPQNEIKNDRGEVTVDFDPEDIWIFEASGERIL
jgi:multiple sugar transport system ATP-binding protein